MIEVRLEVGRIVEFQGPWLGRNEAGEPLSRRGSVGLLKLDGAGERNETELLKMWIIKVAEEGADADAGVPVIF